MKAITYNERRQRHDVRRSHDIPRDLADDAPSEHRHHLLESRSPSSTTQLLDEYLAREAVHRRGAAPRASARARSQGKINPVLCGSAFKNKGVQRLLDAVVDFLPSPLDKPPVEGHDPTRIEHVTRKPSDDEPFSALAFKIMTDPYVGKLTFFRVYSGKIKTGDHGAATPTTGKKERIGRLVQMHANKREEISEVYCRRHRGRRSASRT